MSLDMHTLDVYFVPFWMEIELEYLTADNFSEYQKIRVGCEHKTQRNMGLIT